MGARRGTGSDVRSPQAHRLSRPFRPGRERRASPPSEPLAHDLPPMILRLLALIPLMAAITGCANPRRASAVSAPPKPSGPEAFSAFLKGELDRWARIITAARITAE